MRKFVICLFSIILLSALIAKASSTAFKASKTNATSKFLLVEKSEKLETEEEERLASNQLKNNEFVHSHYHHCFVEASCTFLFSYVVSIFPSSYLEMPERPPKKNWFTPIK